MPAVLLVAVVGMVTDGILMLLLLLLLENSVVVAVVAGGGSVAVAGSTGRIVVCGFRKNCW